MYVLLLSGYNFNKRTYILTKSEVLPQPHGPWGGADIRFLSPQPDNSLHCETTDAGLYSVSRGVFTPHLSLVLIAPTHGAMARLS